MTKARPVVNCIVGADQASPSDGTLVLLHGIQGTAAAWRGVIERLPADIRIIAPNLRGRGGSFSPDDETKYRLSDFAEDLAGVLSVLRGPIRLCGWSMGVLVALEYLRRYGQDRLAGLVLASGSACVGSGARWFTGVTAEAVAEEAVARAERLALTDYASPAAVAGAWLSVRQADLRETAALIRVPTLVVHGTLDEECPFSHGQEIAGLITGSRFEPWDGAGHNLMAADPDRFAGLLAGFWREHSKDDHAADGLTVA